MPSEEKRAHVRTRVRYAVRVRCGTKGEFAGVVENLGALGAFVSTPDFDVLLEVGQRVSLSVVRPDVEPLEAEGEIVRLEQEFSGGDIRRSFAVRFDREVKP